MERHRVRRRRASVIVASSLITLGLGLTAAPSAHAKADVTSDRVAGNDRFETAADAATTAFPTGSSKVLIASGRTFPDALSGAALGLPILLTERDTLPSATAQAIDDLHAKDAVILGGTAAVSAAVANEIGHHATVTRIAGNDRYDTAAKIAQSIGAANVESVSGKKTAIIATGLGFADALAGGPLATGNSGAPVLPILLVNDKVPQSTSDALSALGIKQVLILGGTSAVSTSVESDLKTKTGNQPVRLGGSSRYATAAIIGDFAIDTLGFPGAKMLLASGAGFSDALAGGPLGGVRSAPLLLTDPSRLSDDTKAFFEDHSGTIDQITTLGGTAAVSNSAQSSADAAAQTTPKAGANEVFKISPSTNVNQPNSTTTKASTRDYTATGLGNTIVDLVIMRCGNITTADDGTTVFVNSDADSKADGGADPGDTTTESAVDEADTPAAITKINGSDMNADDPTRDSNDYEPNITPVSGTVTFTVTGPSGSGAASSCIRPVIFEDSDSDNAFGVPNGANPGAPDEKFGTGGETTFSPTGGGNGPIGTRDISAVDTSRDSFDACTITGQTKPTDNPPNQEIVDSNDCAGYHYDSNDTFKISSIVVTMADFENKLSPHDDITGTYADQPSGVSTFNLTNEAPEAPPAPTVAGTGTFAGVRVRWDEDATDSVERYDVYRATVASGATCTATIAGASLLGTVDDTTPPDAAPAPPPQPPEKAYHFDDTSIQPGTSYCYNIVAHDHLDTSGPSSGTGFSNATGAMIKSATASSTDDSNLSATDVHTLVFSQKMTFLATANYKVTSNGLPPTGFTIDCTPSTGNATCTSSDGITLTVVIKSNIMAPPMPYPLKITSTSGMNPEGTTAGVNLATSDVTIDVPAA